MCTFNPGRWTWDDAKSGRTFRDRGIDFPYTLRIVSGRTLMRRSDRPGERRYLATGEIAGKCYTVVYTKRIEQGERVRRVISAQRAWISEEKALNAR